ncbi:uncharacterized protein LOC120130986 [Hibiscus syriacus]|uniref:uncharacterized protein LOC120130986 n=1 Tax=Hibiscus syriacus TaxID=106335 RepID=UPI00192451DB|nr:uncharacterized protein LOC120130986 [Hibiscus syriacus]
MVSVVGVDPSLVTATVCCPPNHKISSSLLQRCSIELLHPLQCRPYRSAVHFASQHNPVLDSSSLLRNHNAYLLPVLLSSQRQSFLAVWSLFCQPGLPSSPSNLVSLSITCHRLNGENYIAWSQSVRLFITSRQKQQYLSDNMPILNPSNPQYDNWLTENTTIMSWLLNSMLPDINANFMFYTTASKIWNAAKETYSNQENSSSLFSIECRINDLKQGDLTVMEYFTQLSRLWQQIDLLETPAWQTGVDAKLYKGLLEKQRIFQFLSGLSVSLDDILGRIMGIRLLLSLHEVFSEVRREGSHRSLMLPPFVESSVLNTHSSGDTRVKKGRPWCDHCRKPGHVRDKYWKLHGRPTNWTPSKSSSCLFHGNFVVTTLEGGSFSRQ